MAGSKSLENLKKGRRFSKSNQPENSGRKPSGYKKIMSELEGVNDQLSQEDYIKIVRTLLTLSGDQLKEIAESKESPLVVVMIASAIAGDIENRQLGNLERLLDRVFGKATQKSEITGKDGKDLINSIQIIDKTGLFS